MKSILIVLLFWPAASRFQTSMTASPGPVATQQAASKPSARLGHCLVYDGQRRRVVLLDGYRPPHQPELGEVWGWDGKRWELLPGSGPAARSLSGAVFDTRRKQIISYGGVGNRGYEDLKGDTWAWDGRSWQQMTDTSVGTRDHHAMAYDAARGKTVMYGGQTSSRTWATDTWEWDGLKWTKLAVPGPGGRAHFAMVYDSKRKRVVLFGGLGDDSQYHNDTWEWDGVNWRKVSDGGPPPRARHRLAFDSHAGVVILYGGDGVKTAPGGFRVLEDMWAWDGVRWTEIKTNGPGKRFSHAMTYDAGRRKTVLYGGSNGANEVNDTWEWDGQRWVRAGD
ncbi:MAG: kelch motif-containing protein [Pyrinomonadaceae bacterium]|nr:kelch motif-containing protein [Pyrinomonadaceae bacterium]